jgi:hypothetical protein
VTLRAAPGAQIDIERVRGASDNQRLARRRAPQSALDEKVCSLGKPERPKI